MSDQVTYATLMFQDSAGAGTNQDGNNLRKRGQASSHLWRLATLGLLTLCLLLAMGLVTLGIMFFQMSNGITSDSEKLNQLQNVIQQQQANLSQQVKSYRKVPVEEGFLQSQISNLLERQEHMATNLCRKLLIHISDHKCKPCPQTWQWDQSSCYHFTVDEERSWSDSRRDCEEKNSTLVKIDSLTEKNFLQSQPLPTFSFFWLGLSWNKSSGSWFWEDGSAPTPSLFNNTELAQINGSKGCAYFERGNIFASRCSAEIAWICERTAALVKIEDLY